MKPWSSQLLDPHRTMVRPWTMAISFCTSAQYKIQAAERALKAQVADVHRIVKCCSRACVSVIDIVKLQCNTLYLRYCLLIGGIWRRTAINDEFATMMHAIEMHMKQKMVRSGCWLLQRCHKLRAEFRVMPYCTVHIFRSLA